MLQIIAKYVAVVGPTMLKFVFGPVTSLALGLHWSEAIILTVVGMMLSVTLFTFGGQYMKEKILKKWAKPKRLFTKQNRMKVRVWRKYGMFGVAFLTPIILTPIGGTLLATSFGEHNYRIILYMLVSALFWSVVLVAILYYLAHTGAHVFGH